MCLAVNKIFLKNFKSEELFSIKLKDNQTIDMFGAGPSM